MTPEQPARGDGKTLAARPTKPPFGYCEGPSPAALLVQTPEAPIVRGIFLSLAAGEFPDRIAQRLRAAGASGPNQREWTPRLVADLARNPKYVGLTRTKGRYAVAPWEPLVDEALWDAAQGRAREPSLRERQGRDKVAQQRQAFEEGYWHHQRTPRGCIRAGEWPRYVLHPDHQVEAYRDIIRALAAGTSLADVELRARHLVADVTTWKEPARGVRRALLRHILHPALAGYAVWNHGTSTTELREAQWPPMVTRQDWQEARRRVGAQPPVTE